MAGAGFNWFAEVVRILGEFKECLIHIQSAVTFVCDTPAESSCKYRYRKYTADTAVTSRVGESQEQHVWLSGM